MTTYASQTSVPTSRSRDEIEKTLTRYGASGFAFAQEQGRAMIDFIAHERTVRIMLPLPDPDDYSPEADLSLPLPARGRNGDRLRVRQIGSTPLSFPVPWPMTRAGGVLFILVEFAVILGGIAGALWVGWQLFEPSLLRLLPVVLFLLATKFVLLPALYRFGRRPGMDRRDGGAA